MRRLARSVIAVALLTLLAPTADAEPGRARPVVAIGTASSSAALGAVLAGALRRHVDVAPSSNLRVTPTVRELRVVRARGGLELRCAVAIQIERVKRDGSTHWLAEAVGRGVVIGDDLHGAKDQCVRAAIHSVAAERVRPYLAATGR